MHYTHQNICIDLTTVHSADSAMVGCIVPLCSHRHLITFFPQPTNELEVEFRDAKKLMQEAIASSSAAARQEWTPYYDQVLIFLNNIRMLIRNAGQ